MDIEEVRAELVRRGGLAARSELPFTKHLLARAVTAGVIQRVGSGRYALPVVATAELAAHRYNGVLSHLSAAASYGWSMLRPPGRPQVMVPRGRKPPSIPRAATVELRWGTLTGAERAAGRTAPLRTVVDCARTRPFLEALGIADSGLRSRLVDGDELLRAAQLCRGPGTGQVVRVADAASGLAANAFESGLRAICLDVPMLQVRPQVGIGENDAFLARVDLADLNLGLVLECDGYEVHGTRRGFRTDRARYTALTMLDWLVFSYVWEDVAVTPDVTRARLRRWAEREVARYPAGRPGVWRSTVLFPQDVQCSA